jgi:hypothetical protein
MRARVRRKADEALHRINRQATLLQERRRRVLELRADLDAYLRLSA